MKILRFHHREIQLVDIIIALTALLLKPFIYIAVHVDVTYYDGPGSGVLVPLYGTPEDRGDGNPTPLACDNMFQTLSQERLANMKSNSSCNHFFAINFLGTLCLSPHPTSGAHV